MPSMENLLHSPKRRWPYAFCCFPKSPLPSPAGNMVTPCAEPPVTKDGRDKNTLLYSEKDSRNKGSCPLLNLTALLRKPIERLFIGRKVLFGSSQCRSDMYRPTHIEVTQCVPCGHMPTCVVVSHCSQVVPHPCICL